MKKTGFYIIKDKFFEDMEDPYLKGNKAGNEKNGGSDWLYFGSKNFDCHKNESDF